jgi:hypothetical protein
VAALEMTEQQAPKVQLGQQVDQEQLEQQVPKVRRAPVVGRELLEQLVPKDQQAIKDQQACRVIQVPLVHKDHKGHRDLKVIKEMSVPKVQPAIKDQQVPMEQLDHKGL